MQILLINTITHTNTYMEYKCEYVQLITIMLPLTMLQRRPRHAVPSQFSERAGLDAAVQTSCVRRTIPAPSLKRKCTFAAPDRRSLSKHETKANDMREKKREKKQRAPYRK